MMRGLRVRRGLNVVITGGSSGIGRAVGRQLVAQGANVCLIARGRDALDATVAEFRAAAVDPEQKAAYFAADVSEVDVVSGALEAAEATLGPIGLVICSAGICKPGYAEALSLMDFTEQMRVNYFGTVTVVKSLLPGMIKRREGWIAGVSSLAGLKGIFGYSAYCGSKFAVVGFLEALRSELRRFGIGVSVLCPPDTHTPMLEGEAPLRPAETRRLAELARTLEADEVAGALLSGMTRGKFIIVPGWDCKLLRVVNGIAPGLMDRITDGVVRRSQRALSEMV